MKSFKILTAVLLLSFVSACASLSSSNGDELELPIVYGTLKVIERDNGISQGDVLNVVDKLEVFIDESSVVSSDAIVEYVTSLEEWQELSPADKYLVSTLFTSVEESIKHRLEIQEIVPEDVKERVLVIIGYIKTAAVMY